MVSLVQFGKGLNHQMKKVVEDGWMDGWLCQTRLIPDGDNIDLHDDDDACQKETMVPSIVFF